MIIEGIDVDDEAAIAHRMAGFNDRPFEERAAILTDDLIGAGRSLVGLDPTLLLVEAPDEDEARASAARSTLLGLAGRFVEFIGEGRKVTPTGNVSLAVARQLVAILETGDRFDEKIGDRAFKTKSAADLPQLSFVIRLATKARFVRVLKGRLVPTNAGRDLGRDPLADMVWLVEAIDDVGVVSARTAGGRYIWTTLAPLFDDLFVPITTLLLSATEVAFSELVDNAFEEFEAEIDLDNPPWDEARRHDFVESEMRTAIETLESAGVASWASEQDTSIRGATRRNAGTVTLTPAGRWVLFEYLRDAHHLHIEAAGLLEWTTVDFEDLIAACETGGPGEFARFTREVDAWIDHRGDDAPVELTDVARSTADPAVRHIALGVLAERFGRVAEAHVRSLLDDPASRGAALVHLVDHELEPAEALCDPDPAVPEEDASPAPRRVARRRRTPARAARRRAADEAARRPSARRHRRARRDAEDAPQGPRPHPGRRRCRHRDEPSRDLAHRAALRHPGVDTPLSRRGDRRRTATRRSLPGRRRRHVDCGEVTVPLPLGLRRSGGMRGLRSMS